MPRALQERTLALSRETEVLTKRLGRSPSVREVAMALGFSTERAFLFVIAGMKRSSSTRRCGRVERDGLVMHDLTQREIGALIGYSQMHVSRLLKRALQRLKTASVAA